MLLSNKKGKHKDNFVCSGSLVIRPQIHKNCVN